MTAETWDDVAARLAGRPELHDSWLNGLAWYQAATGPVLWRIITASQRLQYGSSWLENRKLTQEAGAALVRHPDRRIRLDLTVNPSLGVRLYLSMRKDLTEEQRAAIPYTTPEGYHEVPGWLAELAKDPEAIAGYARSSHVLIRRSVAMARHLPPEAVALLASDEDFFVKLTLAEYCDDAPHELIIDMFTTWNGLKWSFLAYRPNFTRNGMAADFAADPNPRLRWAALFDPTASPELVEALSYDPDSQVWPWAISDPRLPLARLHEALGIPDTALAAARNPTLPEPVMHKFLDYIGAGQAEPSEQGQTSA